MFRRIPRRIQLFSRLFSKKCSNTPKVIIMEQRKEAEEIEKEYSKLGGSSNFNLNTHNDMKSYNALKPYKHNTRMDEKYPSDTQPAYSSPLKGYAVNDKPSRTQTLKKPVASRFADNYYEAIRQKKNFSNPTDVQGNGRSNLNKTVETCASKTDNYSKNDINNSGPTKLFNSTNKPTLKTMSRNAKKSPEALRLDEMRHQKESLNKKYGKSLTDVMKSTGTVVVNTKNCLNLTNLKPAAASDIVKTQMANFVERKDFRRPVLTTGVVGSTKTQLNNNGKCLKGGKLGVAFRTNSNSSKDIE